VAPMLVLGPFGGALADRHDRRRLLIASDVARALSMAALAGVAVAGLPILLAPLLAGLATAAGTVYPPAVAASTARLVADEELPRASALRSAIGQGAIVAGPALGAVVLVAASPAVAILANGLTFLVSAAAILAIPGGPAFLPSRSAERAGLLADVRTGAQALRGAPTAVRLIAADVLCSAVYGFLTVTLMLVSRRVGAGDGGYGVLLGAFGAGGLIGAAIAGRLAPEWRRALGIALPLVAVPLALLGAVPAFADALALALVAGGGMVVAEVLSETALPRVLGHDVLARAYGLVLPASVAGIVAGSLVAGPLVSLLGLQGALTAAGATVLLAAAALIGRPSAPAQRAAVAVR
jgi:predicted MFS family arabinose efflux permease